MFSLDTLLVLVVAAPLAAAVLTAALGRRYLRHRAHWPALVAVAVSLAAAVALAWQWSAGLPALPAEEHHAGQTATGHAQHGEHAQPEEHETAGERYLGREHVVVLWRWAAVQGAWGTPPFVIDVVLRVDTLTCLMLLVVNLVGLLVVLYSVGYMHDDPGYWRYFTYVALFVFSMNMLVSVSNFLLLYVFWEAVGLCSYLLIGFWFQRPAAADAGKKAFLVNRVGDFGFALGVFLLWSALGTLNFHDTVLPDGNLVPGVLGQHWLSMPVPYGGAWGSRVAVVVACLLLFVGACGKSAQFPLHVWLPDAMEGPTPVSALIHAATMVTAGVYLVVRTAPMFLVSQSAHLVVAAIGGLTALMAAFIALTQTDLKRVLAYSTISQLGYMFLALGTASFAGLAAGMFHLFTHAFFKALLFLGAGSVMHAMGGVIDMNRFGGLRRRLPLTYWTFLLGALALAGVAPLAGFWSKDAVLAAVHTRAMENPLGEGYLYLTLYYTGMVTALMTAFYTFRAVFLTFHGEERLPEEAHGHAHEGPWWMTVPLVLLALGAVGAGLLGGPITDWLRHTPSLAFAARLTGTGHHGFHWQVAALSTAMALGGVALAAWFYLAQRQLVASLAETFRAAMLYQLSYGKLFLDEIYTVLIVIPLRVLGWVLFILDQFLIDGLVNLVGYLVRALGGLFRPLQTGLVQFYALAMLLGLLVLLASMLRWPLG